jgi:hypothetical protein
MLSGVWCIWWIRKAITCTVLLIRGGTLSAGTESDDPCLWGQSAQVNWIDLFYVCDKSYRLLQWRTHSHTAAICILVLFWFPLRTVFPVLINRRVVVTANTFKRSSSIVGVVLTFEWIIFTIYKSAHYVWPYNHYRWACFASFRAQGLYLIISCTRPIPHHFVNKIYTLTFRACNFVTCQSWKQPQIGCRLNKWLE